MSKYDALLFPADAFHSIGPFRFPVLGTLLPGEARSLDLLTKKDSAQSYATMRLAKRIARDKNIKSSVAVDMLTGSDGPDRDLIYDYVDELEELNNSGVSELDILEERVTVVLQYRGEVQLEGTDGWTKTEDWTSDDTKRIPVNMQREISEFILREKEGQPHPSPEAAAGNASPTRVVVTKTK